MIVYQQELFQISMEECKACGRFVLACYIGGSTTFRGRCGACTFGYMTSNKNPLYLLQQGWLIPHYPPFTHQPAQLNHMDKLITVGLYTLSMSQWSLLMGKPDFYLSTMAKLYSSEKVYCELKEWFTGYHLEQVVHVATEMATKIFSGESFEIPSANITTEPNINNTLKHPKAKGLLVRGIWQSYTEWSLLIGKHVAFVSATVRKHGQEYAIEMIQATLGW